MKNTWRDKFTKNTLEKGKQAFINRRVADIEYKNGIYTAAVLGKKRYEVSLALKDDGPYLEKCTCPVAVSGRCCEHMAALLFALEAQEEPELPVEAPEKTGVQEREAGEEVEAASAQEDTYSLMGDTWENPEETAGGEEQITLLEEYRYFKREKIIGSMNFTGTSWKEGESLFRKNRVQIDEINSGWNRSDGTVYGSAQGTVRDGRNEVSVVFLFSAEEMEDVRCSCPKCRGIYFYRRGNKIRCQYTAAVAYAVREYLQNNNLGDATSIDAMLLMREFQIGRGSQLLSGTEKESIHLEPRLIRKSGMLQVSFRVGSGRLFVVKKLEEFSRNVHTGAAAMYGSGTQLNHSLENFCSGDRKWIPFIDSALQEEQRFCERLERSRWYTPREASLGSAIELFGSRLDEFYELLGGGTVEFEDRDEKLKGKLAAGSRDLELRMRIAPERSENGEEFQGIRVRGELPVLYQGAGFSYFIEGGHLYRAARETMERIRPLAEISEQGRFGFVVGRSHLAEFYYRMLPEIAAAADVTVEDEEEIRRYLPPEARITFYLDYEEQTVACRIMAKYAEREFSVLENLENRNPQAFRDVSKESEAIVLASEWFPERERDLLICRSEEKKQLLIENGVQALMKLGEVMVTGRFRRYATVRRLKVSVGVSVSRGLLELTVSSEDISREEMLEVLAGYREKKKYHRLRDGAAVSLEDPSVEMLAEMMEGLQIRDKDFLRGKMELPMYRTLYLNSLLEENAEVYSRRDSQFRELIKEFKTVGDADFEEPDSLSGVMRRYQKNGFQWLRTLEQWKLGGILADDMGLGKTLQMIAVLLSAKEERRGGVSLVVAPASLVFNWCEEIRRFAPGLAVSMVTGTQAEREVKIQAYQDADVLVTSYDLLKRDIALYEGKHFYYEVIDEAQYIKNHTTAAAKAVKVISSTVRCALTGTPIENRLSELWSIFDFLMPGYLYTYETFKKKLEIPIVRHGDEAAMERLKKLTAPFILRRVKEKVLKDLPEKLEETRYIRFGEEQQRLYDAQALHMRERLAAQNEDDFNKNRMQVLAELTKLRQICCSPSLYLEDYRGQAAKEEACLELIQSAIDGGHRMLVFSQFTTMLELLQQKLSQAGIAYFTITGATPKEKRLQLVREFNGGDVPVFLISLRAGGVGLNLTGADVVIHYDPWWNQAVEHQATDRTHRIGQTKKVTVYKLIVKNSIEEKIQKLQETKGSLAEQVMESGTGKIGSMTREEILELLKED